MTYNIPSRYEGFTLAVTVATERPEKIRLILKDADSVNTVLTDRYNTIVDQETFYVQVPVSGRACILTLYNERTGNIPAKSDPTFKVVSVKRLPLKKWLGEIDFLNIDISRYIKFCTRFCFNAGWLPAKKYVSDNGKFTIEYLPRIIGDNKSELNTPARISKNTANIQASQSKLIPMTHPMRMAIMLHEFSHFYMNENMDSETEADLNALKIYLALGYPIIEGSEAFTRTFVGTPTPGNQKRYMVIKKFLDEYKRTHNYYG